jgi:hypothetical protein
VSAEAGGPLRRRLPGVRSVAARLGRRREAGAPVRLRPSDYHRPILSLEEGNELIRTALAAGEPFVAGRSGTVELDCVTHYLKYRRGGGASPYPDTVAQHMGNNAGFFPVTAQALDGFAEEYLAAVGALDASAVWFNPGESDLAREICPGAELVPLRSLEPYYHRDPWSAELAGRRVLVIHPFAESIEDNYTRRRQVLFEDPRVLPAFELHVVKAVQSIAGEETEFASWFDALACMKSEMEAVEFDVCIAGAGAYGLPLAAHAKALGKVAIHMGGATQVLFGIRGRRWDDHEIISKLYNEHWTRPRPSETPRNFWQVEDGGAYW